MSWSAGRKTSRAEDRAYSLFGIFNVNMPLLYGEGDKAFDRLQRELIRTSDDSSILAWSSPQGLEDEQELLDFGGPFFGTQLLSPSPDYFQWNPKHTFHYDTRQIFLHKNQLTGEFFLIPFHFSLYMAILGQVRTDPMVTPKSSGSSLYPFGSTTYAAQQPYSRPGDQELVICLRNERPWSVNWQRVIFRGRNHMIITSTRHPYRSMNITIRPAYCVGYSLNDLHLVGAGYTLLPGRIRRALGTPKVFGVPDLTSAISQRDTGIRQVFDVASNMLFILHNDNGAFERGCLYAQGRFPPLQVIEFTYNEMMQPIVLRYALDEKIFPEDRFLRPDDLVQARRKNRSCPQSIGVGKILYSKGHGSEARRRPHSQTLKRKQLMVQGCCSFWIL